MSRTKWIIFGVGGIVVGLMAVTFFATHERVKKKVQQPPTGEARKNPYFALERYLNEMGLETSTRNRIDQPGNSTSSILVLVDRRREYSPRQIDAWRDWVRRGGHLIVPAPPASLERSPFLEAFEIRHSEASDARTAGKKGKTAELESSDHSEPANTSRPERLYEVTVATDALADWNSEATDWTARNSEGNRIAFSRPFSDGRVTLVADPHPFRNRQLGEKNHAEFAWDTITLGSVEATETATIVRFASTRSWIAYVAESTWPFLVGLGLLVVFALNGGRWRFGPERPAPSPERRSRVEHIRATGEFLWDRGAASRLLESTRSALLDELADKRPSITDAKDREKRRIATDELALDSEEATRIFEDRDHLSRSEFRARIETMERYRRTL